MGKIKISEEDMLVIWVRGSLLIRLIFVCSAAGPASAARAESGLLRAGAA